MRQNINQLVEKGGGQLSDAIMKSGEYTCIANEFSSGRKKLVKIIPIISKSLFFGRVVLLLWLLLVVGSHFVR